MVFVVPVNESICMVCVCRVKSLIPAVLNGAVLTTRSKEAVPAFSTFISIVAVPASSLTDLNFVKKLTFGGITGVVPGAYASSVKLSKRLFPPVPP